MPPVLSSTDRLTPTIAIGAGACNNAADLFSRYNRLVAEMVALNSQVLERIDALETTERRWNALVEKVENQLASAASQVDLNVGGRRFTTTKDVLLRWEDTYFQALLGSGHWEPSREGAFFIDRNPTTFERIFSAMQSEKPIETEGLTEQLKETLWEDIDYFQLPADLGHLSLRWDPLRCHAMLSISGRLLTKSRGGGGWKSALARPTRCSEPLVLRRQARIGFRFRIVSFGHLGDIMVGFCRADTFSRDGPNYSDNGWFLQCGLGSVWAPSCRSGRPYCIPLQPGETWEAHFDSHTGQVSFSGPTGEYLGVAFSDVTPCRRNAAGADECEMYSDDSCLQWLRPCCELWGEGAAIVIED